MKMNSPLARPRTRVPSLQWIPQQRRTLTWRTRVCPAGVEGWRNLGEPKHLILNPYWLSWCGLLNACYVGTWASANLGTAQWVRYGKVFPFSLVRASGVGDASDWYDSVANMPERGGANPNINESQKRGFSCQSILLWRPGKEKQVYVNWLGWPYVKEVSETLVLIDRRYRKKHSFELTTGARNWKNRPCYGFDAWK